MQPEVRGTRGAWLACGRELLSLDSSGADRARGVDGRRRGKRRHHAIQKSAPFLFTQMRAETRSLATLPFAFRFTRTIKRVPIPFIFSYLQIRNKIGNIFRFL